MKVSAAVLVGCVALAATADVVSGAVQTKPGNKLETAAAASDEIEAVSSTGNHEAKKKKRAGHRALRGGDAEAAKAAKKHNAKKNQKKRSLKAEKGAPPPPPPANENRAYTYTTAAAANNNNNKKQQQQQQAANNANAPYVNNKYDYLDRYSAYLTPKQLEQLRNNNPPAPPASNQNQETNVGGAESDDYDAVVVSAPSYSSSYTQTAAVQQPQRPVQQQQQRPAATTTTPYVSTLDLNRGSDANGEGQEALNRGFEKEAPIAGYDAATGYGSTGNGGNANANGSGALDTTPSSSSARPYVQTTEWKPIDKSVWVEHYVPGVGNNPNTPPTGSTNSNIGFPNRNPGLTTGGGSANANRIPASSAPCNGANPNAAPTQPIQTIFENWLWGTCSTTAGGCRPGSCCLIRPGMGGACVSFDEICEPGQSASEGDCPYSWITSDKCACDSGSAILP